MKDKLKVAAPYVSILGLLVLVSIPAVLWLIRQNGGTPPSWLGWVLLVVGLVLALAWPLLCPDDFRRAIGKRQARYGGNALVMVAAVIVLLVAVNFLASRRYWTWDLTTNKQFTLSPQTIQIIEGLDQPVTLTAVLGSGDQAAEDLDRLVDRYRQRSDKLSYQRIDPSFDIVEAQGLEQRLGQPLPGRALVSEAGAQHATVFAFDEQSVTEAIVKATRAKDRSVTFTTGHGEQDPMGGGDSGRGYSGVKDALEREGYTVSTQNLTALTDTLKADAVIVAGPQRPFLPEEAKVLSDYVAGGGSVLLLLDPGQDAGLDSVMAPWGIKPQADMVIQPASLLGNAAAVIAAGENYQFHTITKDLSGLMSTLLATQSFAVGEPVTSTLQTSKLIEIGTEGGTEVWGETDLEGLGQNRLQLDPTDIRAPLVLAVAGEGGEGKGRLAVFGTSNLASDTALQQIPQGARANFDLFLNSVNWLTADEDLISIRPTQPDDRTIATPARPFLLLFVLVGLIPLTIFGVGFWVYWRRR